LLTQMTAIKESNVCSLSELHAAGVVCADAAYSCGFWSATSLSVSVSSAYLSE
jgi:hypothetical protein